MCLGVQESNNLMFCWHRSCKSTIYLSAAEEQPKQGILMDESHAPWSVKGDTSSLPKLYFLGICSVSLINVPVLYCCHLAKPVGASPEGLVKSFVWATLTDNETPDRVKWSEAQEAKNKGTGWGKERSEEGLKCESPQKAYSSQRALCVRLQLLFIRHLLVVFVDRVSPPCCRPVSVFLPCFYWGDTDDHKHLLHNILITVTPIVFCPTYGALQQPL